MNKSKWFSIILKTLVYAKEGDSGFDLRAWDEKGSSLKPVI